MPNDQLVLSPKHGVNPSLLACFICGTDYGVALLGLIRGTNDGEAPRRVTRDGDYCEACEARLRDGQLCLLEATDDAERRRTGRYVFVREAFADSITDPALRRAILQRRVAHIAPDAMQHLLDRLDPPSSTGATT